MTVLNQNLRVPCPSFAHFLRNVRSIRELLGMTECPPSSRFVDFIEYLLCDSPNVDVALTWNADKQKAPRYERPKALLLFGNFGCGSRI